MFIKASVETLGCGIQNGVINTDSIITFKKTKLCTTSIKQIKFTTKDKNSTLWWNYEDETTRDRDYERLLNIFDVKTV